MTTLETIRNAIRDEFEERLPRIEAACRRFTTEQLEIHCKTCAGIEGVNEKIRDLKKTILDHILEHDIKNQMKSEGSKGSLSLFNKIMIAIAIVGAVGFSTIVRWFTH